MADSPELLIILIIVGLLVVIPILVICFAKLCCGCLNLWEDCKREKRRRRHSAATTLNSIHSKSSSTFREKLAQIEGSSRLFRETGIRLDDYPFIADYAPAVLIPGLHDGRARDVEAEGAESDEGSTSIPTDQSDGAPSTLHSPARTSHSAEENTMEEEDTEVVPLLQAHPEVMPVAALPAVRVLPLSPTPDHTVVEIDDSGAYSPHTALPDDSGASTHTPASEPVISDAINYTLLSALPVERSVAQIHFSDEQFTSTESLNELVSSYDEPVLVSDMEELPVLLTTSPPHTSVPALAPTHPLPVHAASQPASVSDSPHSSSSSDLSSESGSESSGEQDKPAEMISPPAELVMVPLDVPNQELQLEDPRLQGQSSPFASPELEQVQFQSGSASTTPNWQTNPVFEYKTQVSVSDLPSKQVLVPTTPDSAHPPVSFVDPEITPEIPPCMPDLLSSPPGTSDVPPEAVSLSPSEAEPELTPVSLSSVVVATTSSADAAISLPTPAVNADALASPSVVELSCAPEVHEEPDLKPTVAEPEIPTISFEPVSSEPEVPQFLESELSEAESSGDVGGNTELSMEGVVALEIESAASPDSAVTDSVSAIPELADPAATMTALPVVDRDSTLPQATADFIPPVLPPTTADFADDDEEVLTKPVGIEDSTLLSPTLIESPSIPEPQVEIMPTDNAAVIEELIVEVTPEEAKEAPQIADELIDVQSNNAAFVVAEEAVVERSSSPSSCTETGVLNSDEESMHPVAEIASSPPTCTTAVPQLTPMNVAEDVSEQAQSTDDTEAPFAAEVELVTEMLPVESAEPLSAIEIQSPVLLPEPVQPIPSLNSVEDEGLSNIGTEEPEPSSSASAAPLLTTVQEPLTEVGFTHGFTHTSPDASHSPTQQLVDLEPEQLPSADVPTGAGVIAIERSLSLPSDYVAELSSPSQLEDAPEVFSNNIEAPVEHNVLDVLADSGISPASSPAEPLALPLKPDDSLMSLSCGPEDLVLSHSEPEVLLVPGVRSLSLPSGHVGLPLSLPPVAEDGSDVFSADTDALLMAAEQDTAVISPSSSCELSAPSSVETSPTLRSASANAAEVDYGAATLPLRPHLMWTGVPFDITPSSTEDSFNVVATSSSSSASHSPATSGAGSSTSSNSDNMAYEE